ncbi:hypothetical protein RKE30_20280 [Streptomyces sp. Li-HN-5-11]|uniref:hypothetical protein n=1 Tax=Streptomyces sp. Li-HN-5-11 TaxID=3075432 RepID=UPI0028AE0E43|nr:hypothetical protein [Streptomyces sp. Li-HN-5-11]WNM32587.1 hypothetical protein RKE30_20280 [Streptomyces sp. Li-HN-5-11]WOP38667.1 hypothetical protein RKE32_35360 [Streptomyces sp. Li-HN-5-13]
MSGMGVLSPAILNMALSGLLVAAGVPALIHFTRAWAGWRRFCLPAWVALPLFVVLHASVVLTEPWLPSGLARLAVEALLLCAAMLYWLPVLGTRHRLSDPARSVYLYLSMPLLDLPAVVMVAMGHVAGGLSMVAAMVPIGLAALGITWRWITQEERLAQADAR